MTDTYNEVHEIFDRLDDKRTYRIEALRAASRVVAGVWTAKIVDLNGRQTTAAEKTLSIAEVFARWLETGER